MYWAKYFENFILYFLWNITELYPLFHLSPSSKYIQFIIFLILCIFLFSIYSFPEAIILNLFQACFSSVRNYQCIVKHNQLTKYEQDFLSFPLHETNGALTSFLFTNTPLFLPESRPHCTINLRIIKWLTAVLYQVS